MSVRVRLTRVGSKKNPIWRVVVADQRSPRDGRIIESLGHYNPQTDPSTIRIDRERLEHWVQRGAQPTNTVLKLLRAPDTVAVASATEAGEAGAGEDGGSESPAGEPSASEQGDSGEGAAEQTADAAEAPAEADASA